MPAWYLYMVRCADNTLYTGIALDVHKRVTEHNNSNKLGARYTRARRPVELVYHEKHSSRSAAQTRESAIKKLSKQEKEKIVCK